MKKLIEKLLWSCLAFLAAGCAVHVEGSREEREHALEAGRALEPEAAPPPLPDEPSVEDYLRTAFYESNTLRQRYWEWRAAIERIPQEASPPDLAFSFQTLFSDEHLKAWDRTTLGLQNSPMAMLPAPAKLEAAGRRALEEARAAGLRFEAEKFSLQAEVMNLILDLALHGELMDLQEEELAAREFASREAEQRIATGNGTQEELLRERTAFDLAQNGLHNLHSDVPALVGRLNVLLGRHPLHPVPFPELPEPRPFPGSDVEILRLALERSPELAALEHEISGREAEIDFAELARVPDFGFLLGLTGSSSQTLGGMLTLPLRGEAIRAGIAEARARLQAAEEARTRYERDLAASFVLALFVVHNAERQVELFGDTLLPRSVALVELARSAYETGTGSLGAVIEAELERVDLERTLVMLRVEREKALNAIETWSALDVEALHPVRGARAMGG